MGRLIAVSMVLWMMQLSAAAHAQTLRLALFKTASGTSEHAPLAAALDPVLQAEVGQITAVNIAALPPLDLASLQLALDCVGETPSCLAVATERTKVDALISPSVARSGSTLVLSLLLYDPQKPSPIHVVTRNLPIEASDQVVIDAAKALVLELFGLNAPAAAPAQAAEPALPEPTAPPANAAPVEPELQRLPETPKPAAPSLVLPIALGAAGVGVIAIGLGFGAASNSSESRYAKVNVKDEASAQHASELLSTARTQATIANVAIVLGAASCVAGGVVYFLQRNRRPDTAPNTQVQVGLGYLGVTGGF